MNARRAVIRLTFSGVDISADINKHLLSLTYTDNEEDKTDDLQLSLDDKEGVWLGSWLNTPSASKGAEISAVIVQKNWESDGKDRVLDCGVFAVDTVDGSGPPAKATIKAGSIPYASTIRTQKKTKAWEYERLRESVETYSTAGPMGGYEYFAKSASALIADVKATSPEPGEVDVRVLLAGGELPEEEILKEVSEILNADTVRPLTDHVTVKAPETVAYNIDVTYYTQEGGAISDDVISENVNAAVGAFKKWQAEKMGRDVNPSYLIQLLMQAGVKRVEVRAPAFATVKDNQVAKIGTTTVTNGGAESE